MGNYSARNEEVGDQNDNQQNFKNYRFLEQINHATFGQISLFQSLKSGTVLYCKEMSFQKESEFRNELERLQDRQQNKHTNILDIIEVHHEQIKSVCSNVYRLVSLMEFIDQDFQAEINLRKIQNRLFTSDDILLFLLSLTNALKYYQEMEITHSALQLSSIFISREGDIKIVDPLVLKTLSLYNQCMTNQSKKGVFISPQQMRGLALQEWNPACNHYKCDVFTIGILLLEIASLQSMEPAYDYTTFTIHQHIIAERLSQLSGTLEFKLINIIASMLEFDESIRPDFLQLYDRLMLFGKGKGKEYQSLNNNCHANDLKNNKRKVEKTQNSANMLNIIGTIKQQLNSQNSSKLQTPSPQEKKFKQKVPAFQFDVKNPKANLAQRIVLKECQNQISNFGSNKIYLQQSDTKEAKENNPHVCSNKKQQQHHYQFQAIQQQQNSKYKGVQQFALDQIQSSANKNMDMLRSPKLFLQLKSPGKQKFNNNDSAQQISNKQELTSPLSMLNLHPQQQNGNQNLNANNYLSFGFPHSQNQQLDNNQITQQIIDSSNQIQGPLQEIYEDGSVYEGEKSNGMRNGKGKFFYADGGFYDGNWSQGRMEGFGQLFYPNNTIAYEGQWNDDKFNGQGIVYNEGIQYSNQIFDYSDFNNIEDFWVKYEGQFVDDNKHGIGTLFLKNKDKFTGRFYNDKIDGQGTFFLASGDIITGVWKNNILQHQY